MICNRKKLKEENKMLQQVMTNPGEIIFREVQFRKWEMTRFWLRS